MNTDNVANELLKIAKEIQAGIWSLPNSSPKIVRLASLIRDLKEGQWPTRGQTSPVTDALYHLLGDDALFDSIDRTGNIYLKQCAEYIEKAIRQLARRPESDFKDPKDYAGLQQMLKHL